MSPQRVDKLNSLLQEVIAEVIQREVKNPHLSPFTSVSKVEVTKDLSHAKVYISVIGDKVAKEHSLLALQSAAGFIAVSASKKMVIRHFPELNFVLDDTVEKQMRIDSILQELKEERAKRGES